MNEENTTNHDAAPQESVPLFKETADSYREKDVKHSFIFELAVVFVIIQLAAPGLLYWIALEGARLIKPLLNVENNSAVDARLSDLSLLIGTSLFGIVLLFGAVRIRKERLRDFGFTLKKFGEECGVALGTCFALWISAMLLVYILSIFMDVETLNEQKNKIILEHFPKEILGVAIVGMVVTVLFEEFYFRAYFIRRLTQISGSLVGAVFIDSLIFGLLHFYQGAIAIAITFIWGLILSGVYILRKSLVGITLAHFLNNAFTLLILHYSPNMGL